MMKTLKTKATAMVARARSTITNNKAEGFVDSGVKILIAIVIGALLLGGLYFLFNNIIIPNSIGRIIDLIRYTG